MLQVLALLSPSPVIRQSAVRTLAQLLDVLPSGVYRSDYTSPSVLNDLANSAQNLRNAPAELEPLRTPLVKMVSSTNTALSEAAGKLLGRINPAGDVPSTALVARARSTDPALRRSAMLELADAKKNSSERFRRSEPARPRTGGQCG